MASLGAVRAVTKRALFDKSIRPFQLIAIRHGGGGPQPWNYLWRPDSKSFQVIFEHFINTFLYFGSLCLGLWINA